MAARLLRPLKLLVILLAVAGLGWWLLRDALGLRPVDAAGQPLRLSFWGPYEEFEMWQEMVATFQAANPGVVVKLEYVPTRYEQKIRQLLVADAAADVILYQDEPFPYLVDRGSFEDLTPYLRRDGVVGELRGELQKTWLSIMVDSFGRYEEHAGGREWRQYAMPVWGGTNLVFYNKDCFRRAGLRVAPLPGPEGLAHDPATGQWTLDDARWTIDEFVRVCQLLTQDRDGDGRIDQFGFLLPTTLYWLPWHRTLGASILNDDRTRTTFYGPECEASLTLYHDLRWRYKVAPTPAELGPMNMGVGFLTGRVAMFTSGPWEMPFCNAAGIDYDALHIPRHPRTGARTTRITCDAVGIYAGSRQKELAWRFIRHLTTPQSQRIVARIQRSIPARRDAAAAFVEQNPRVSTAKFVAAADDYAEMQPITKQWDLMHRVWDAAAQGMQRVDPTTRLTPVQAIGRFYTGQATHDEDSRQLLLVLPPLDEKAIAPYREAFITSGKPN